MSGEQNVSERYEHSDSFLQSEVWAAFKAEFGWRSVRLAHGSSQTGAEEERSLRALVRRAAPGVTIAYVPHGAPAGASAAELEELSRRALNNALGDCCFLRWDLPWNGSEELAIALGSHGFRPAAVDVQPPNTVILDLRKDSEQLLAEMKSKTRYNVRLAAKKGVQVQSESKENLEEWYELYRQTAERDKITIHPHHYYRRLFEIVEDSSPGTTHLELLSARHEGELIAGIIVVHYRGQAVYLYGAGADHKRNLMASYLLQWTAMQRAQEAGCVSYDLFGIPPADDPAHPMHGLYRFKVGFGGSIVRRAGCWDFTLQPLRYELFRAAEHGRQWYYKKFRKRGS